MTVEDQQNLLKLVNMIKQAADEINSNNSKAKEAKNEMEIILNNQNKISKDILSYCSKYDQFDTEGAIGLMLEGFISVHIDNLNEILADNPSAKDFINLDIISDYYKLKEMLGKYHRQEVINRIIQKQLLKDEKIDEIN